MEEIFKYLGKKAGQSFRRGKWLYKSVLGSEEEAIQAEYYVGKEISAGIIKQNAIDQDAGKKDQLVKIGNKLVEKLTNKNRKFNFNILVSSDVNAFALPGGFIFATSAILELCDYNEDEIAFILGHEIGHVVKWHIFNRTIANSSLNIISMVSKPAGLLSSVAVRTVNSLMQNGYSRDQELEADNFGAKLMYAAGYDPKFAVMALNRLGEIHSDNSQFFNYFSTHPLAGARTRQIESMIRKNFR